MEAMNVLVTGGAGFIGSHIVEKLIELNCNKIRILDNLSNENIENINKNHPKIEFMYGCISNLETCRKAVKDMTHICHQAALGSVPRSIHDPLSTHVSNVNGFLNILLASKEEGIKRIVYATSSSVYGTNNNQKKQENITGDVLSPYACSKKINELYANVFVKCYDMELIGLRYFNVFGPRQNPNGPYAAVIPKFIHSIKNHKAPIIFGDGTYSRDFTYVDNAVHANILALCVKNSVAFGNVYNVGCGESITIKEVYYKINSKLWCTIEPIYKETRKGDVPHSLADISNIKKDLFYKPLIYFEEGLNKLLYEK